MQKTLLIAAVLLAACSPVQTTTPEADCLALGLAQVGEFWGPAVGCERVATVPPNGGTTFLQVMSPKLRPGYFVFYELVWQVGLSGNRGAVDLNLIWEKVLERSASGPTGGAAVDRAAYRSDGLAACSAS